MTNHSLLSRIVATIFFPLKRYPVFFGSLWLLSSLASILSDVLAIERWPYKLLCVNFLTAYLLTFVRYRLRSSRFGHLFAAGVYSFFYLCAFIETFLVYSYQMLVWPDTIQLLRQTDSQECAEFCRSTFLNMNFAGFVLVSIAVAGLHLWCVRRFERCEASPLQTRMRPRILWGGDF